MADHTRDTARGHSGVLRTRDLEHLADTLNQEARLLDDLRDALVRQRTGVARNDADAIEDSIHNMGQVLSTLAETRSRRTVLMTLVTGSERTLLHLAAALPTQLPDVLETARDSARRSATAVTRELSVRVGIEAPAETNINARSCCRESRRRIVARV